MLNSKKLNKELLSFIEACPSPFHAVEKIKGILKGSGYEELCEGGEWRLEYGKKYFVTRNLSSVIAIKLPEKKFSGFMITASHCDSPTFKIKDNACIESEYFTRLSTEKYGGMIFSTWLDKMLGIAGRVTVRTKNGFETRLVDMGKECALIPNAPNHLNRTLNEGFVYNPAVDLLPLYGGSAAEFKCRAASLADAKEEDILSMELALYNSQKGALWGDYISSPRLDDLQCVFACLKAFTSAEPSNSASVLCIFDNEETGSSTKQGADSDFLETVLKRTAAALGTVKEFGALAANSFLVSADNAQGCHPNHPELYDKNHTVYMNKGIVIKYNAGGAYTSDAVSTAFFREICRRADVPCQYYANRADLRGGSTLGNISNTHISLNAVDIGLAQLAMHSSYETAGAADTAFAVAALRKFYESSFKMQNDGVFAIA